MNHEEELNVTDAPMVTIVDAIGPHTISLKDNLRTQDADEILRFGITVQHALWQSYKTSVIRKTALIDGRVAAMWGVAGVFMGRVGVPWLLTSPEVKKVSPLRFCRIYQIEVMNMLKLFPRLENYVAMEYTAAIRLLEIIGFTVESPQKLGNGMFCKFWIESSADGRGE